MALSRLPQIDRLVLATVTTVPEWHPQHDTFEPFPVHAWLIRHPDGAILVDTGVGVGNEVIDEWYHPHATPLLDALGGAGVAPSDIAAVVVSHLHFDHCGQQGMLTAPVYVQATEFEAAQTPGYTVPEWAAIPHGRLQLVHGDQELADGVRLLSTPGHSPGHQSVVVNAAGERVVIAAQCAFRAAEPVPANLSPQTATMKPRSLPQGIPCDVSERWLPLRPISATTLRLWQSWDDLHPAGIPAGMHVRT